MYNQQTILIAQRAAPLQAAAGKPGKLGMAIADNRPMRNTAPATIQRQANHTGLPSNLKSGIENLSGMNMDHVQVHYNSAQPAQLNAHAYAQGSQIHIAPGQEKHLPHEAWHVVQQAQGRVRPTVQMVVRSGNAAAAGGGVYINDNRALEKEADVMGEKALQLTNNTRGPFAPKKALQSGAAAQLKPTSSPCNPAQLLVQRFEAAGVIQMVWDTERAREFVTANPPIAGEAPAAWKNRVAVALQATDYANDTPAHRTRLSNAFAWYHRNHFFTAAHAAAFVEANPPQAGHAIADYRNANAAPLAGTNYMPQVSDDLLNTEFTRANAAAFIAAHVPARPITYAQYVAANQAAFDAEILLNRFTNELLENTFTQYWVDHPFTQVNANAFFALHPPSVDEANDHIDAAAYFIEHIAVLTEEWHIFSALALDAARALFVAPMQAFRQAQANSRVQLGVYLAALAQAMRTHVFNGEFNNNAPKGLHAYTAGGIGAGNTLLETIGDVNGVHVIIWTNAAGAGVNKCKWSTMFPQNFPQGMTAWYLLHHNAPAAYPIAERPVQGIPAWLDIVVGTAGDTMFPVLEGVNSTAAVRGLLPARINTQQVHGQTVYNYNNGAVNYRISN